MDLKLVENWAVMEVRVSKYAVEPPCDRFEILQGLGRHADSMEQNLIGYNAKSISKPVRKPFRAIK